MNNLLETTSSLAVTSLATYASLSLDVDQFESNTTPLSSSSSTVNSNPTTITNGQQTTNSTASILDSTDNTNSNLTQQTTNSNQLPPVSSFILPQFRDNSNYWWESNNSKTTNTTSTLNYTGHNNLQPMDDELNNAVNSNVNNTMYFSSLDQYSTTNGNDMCNNYDYQSFNGYHNEPTVSEYRDSGFTSLTSTLSNWCTIFEKKSL